MPSERSLGLRANLTQFSLLVFINAFVGAMVGLERAILPLLAEAEFSLTSHSLILSFIAGFGIVKAFSNLLAGHLSDRIGRKPILLLGWLVGLPVPFLIIWAPTWNWVVFANLLLGINQGLCWSTTVIMKIDLVGPRQRGLAMGINEFAGYLAVALAALTTGYLAASYGLRPQPFYLGIGLAFVGLLVTLFCVRETRDHAQTEARQIGSAPGNSNLNNQLSWRQIFALTTWKERALSSASQAGFVNNLNDGMAWGLLPLFFAAAGISIEEVGVLAAVYPATWGMMQLVTGWLSDRIGRKRLIGSGMLIQALGIWLFLLLHGFAAWVLAAALLGVGTAMVYPILLAAVSDVAYPTWRASAVGVYRLWRDLGYAGGAVLSGFIADLWGMHWAIAAIGALTFLSGCWVFVRMYETLPSQRRDS
jgi:MFS family permease